MRQYVRGIKVQGRMINARNRLNKALGTGIVILLSTMTAQAQEAASGGGGGRVEMYMSAGYLGISRSATQFDVAPGLQFVPFPNVPWLQLGGEVTWQKLSYRDGNTSNLMEFFGLTLNSGGSNLINAVFISVGAAYRSGASDHFDEGSTDPNGLGFYFIAGKRFPITSGFSVRPSFGVVSCGTTGMIFRPFAVSYQF